MSVSTQRPALELSGLTVELRSGTPIVEGVDLSLRPGEILGIVGESGSGKTTTALALLGYSSPGTRVAGGELRVGDRALAMDESMRPLRGSTISYVPQDPGRSLNPALRIGAALRDVLRAHGRTADGEVEQAALRGVGLDRATELSVRYPHQVSGGQQQRVCIALALCCEPEVVVLDEPTTGLDVVSQARIIEELRRLRADESVSMVYVTHDLAVVGELADRVAVMYAGRIVEQGPTHELLRSPRHPYTRGLLASIPDHLRPRAIEPMPGIAVGVGERPAGCPFAPRCGQRTGRCETELPALEPIETDRLVRCWHHQGTPGLPTEVGGPADRAAAGADTAVLAVSDLGAEHRSAGLVVVAAEAISFTVSPGECVALVGESGSGKTTIARTIAGLHPIARGSVALHGAELAPLARRRTREQRRQVQFVFQNPTAALNPRHTVGDTIGRPAHVLRRLESQALDAEVARLLECVRLPARVASRYPHELSGGERQRVAVARALAADPEIILCDEITSALDVSVQAAVLKLLRDLQAELGLGLLFITHDLGVVATIADRVLVLERGVIVDDGPASAVLSNPSADYTKRLLAAAPSVSQALERDSASGHATGALVDLPRP